MEKSCSECSEPTLAQSLCTLCNKWLCYQCTDVHQHQRPSVPSQYSDLHPQQRTSSIQCPDLHQKGSSSLPPNGQGPGSYPCSLLMCHSHRQEPLELFCESCDLLCCSSCHLSSHKNHRVVQTGKALQDQQWLFENLMVQVEERRSAVENSAKQIEDRLHGVKIAHRKAENQIKMAKMIMMNELNKRANLLIEQLEKISEDFQQGLEDQLQGAIEACSQLDHVQKFITWAMTHHCRGPVLFSRALVSFQMQQLLDQPLSSDSWSPPKIKFNWDASYWTKHISSFGQLTVEGGNCTYPQGLACSSILRPQPVTCLSLPPVCHRGREPGYGYQACCEPQRCCLHDIPSQSDLSSLDKNQMDVPICNSSCIQPAHIAASLHQNQQLQRCWDRENLSQLHPSPSPVPVLGLACSRGSMVPPQVGPPQPQSLTKSYLYHQSPAEPDRPTQCTGKLSPSPDLPRELTAAEAEYMNEEIWEETCRLEETRGQTLRADSRELLDDVLQQDRRETAGSPVQQLHPAAEMRQEQQWSRPTQTLRDHRDGRVRDPTSHRSTSLEVSVTTCERVANMQSSRISPGLACTRRRRSQSIPAELAAPFAGPLSERPLGCTPGRETRDADAHDTMDPRQRRASDGLLSTVKESSRSTAPPRGHRSPLQSYKTEPDHSLTHTNEKLDHDTKEKCGVSRNGHSAVAVQKDSGRIRVPVVCLERLKILVSQLPLQGRRQSDPLPASGTEKRTWHAVAPQEAAGGVKNMGTTRSLTAPPYGVRQKENPLTTHSTPSGPVIQGRKSSQEATRSPTDLKYAPQSLSVLEMDSDSDPNTPSEGEAEVSPGESSSEAELERLAEEQSVAAGGAEPCPGNDTTDSEPSLEYEGDPESDPGAGSEDGPEVESGESDVQPDYQVETDSEAPPPDSQGSVESELDVESELELATDEPQPLRSDLEEDCHEGPGQRPLLMANPIAQRGPEEFQSDDTEMESEDFCAVCLIGGDLLCCDRCPKVFHLSCHVPPLLSFPSGDWVCSLCRDSVLPEVEYDCENERTSGEHAHSQGLPACDQRKCERLTLLILSNILSAPFHEPVSPLARHYYQIIKRPMDLSVIRAKLNKRNSQHYHSPDQFIADVFLMFRNCAKFNYPDSEVAQAGRSLEVFFLSQLREVFPDRAFPVAEDDSDSDEYDEAYRAAGGGFPWPERREQCHRKRKRRNSLKSRRHHF
ncbi:E3 ubiquitin-protein ligase TRIM33 isoform X1 [Takifugu rubripes]|uniref:E3 ubiquitin-protein ligase TRIM33 isoform X1 n=1 Tax=Takifugu rubripes TaxID=31033 RepID=UPI0011455A66|nr:E3 ubiquitin-protein ligase TRIM33-like isoform X1 [Takifugu rubripes]XP_011608536.2 E3 ubiquitin-protein ligase TRIM33-like isoform X1 [Takifugu rubripes]